MNTQAILKLLGKAEALAKDNAALLEILGEIEAEVSAGEAPAAMPAMPTGLEELASAEVAL